MSHRTTIGCKLDIEKNLQQAAHDEMAIIAITLFNFSIMTG